MTLYYTSLLYEFYKLYKASKGRAFDTDSRLRVRYSWVRESIEDPAAPGSDRAHQLPGRRIERQSVAAADLTADAATSAAPLLNDSARRQSVATDERTVSWRPREQVRRQSAAPEGHAALGGVNFPDPTFWTRRQSAAADGAATNMPPGYRARRQSVVPEDRGAVGSTAKAWQRSDDTRRGSVSAQQRTNAGVLGQPWAPSGRPRWHSVVATDGETSGSMTVLRPSSDWVRRKSAASDGCAVDRLVTAPEGRRRSLRHSIATADREAFAAAQLPPGDQYRRQSQDRTYFDGVESSRLSSGQSGRHRYVASKGVDYGATASFRPPLDVARRPSAAAADHWSATAAPPPASARMRRKSSGADYRVTDSSAAMSRVPNDWVHRQSITSDDQVPRTPEPHSSDWLRRPSVPTEDHAPIWTTARRQADGAEDDTSVGAKAVSWKTSQPPPQ
ncbi:hypothetical protein V5799_027440 [Amblyomma americanum]|uniref:Uncharacterized protein n=1 Tax=Amblyomma americanum TaxID=6943 RepID=A0AAQ4DFQ2_AMBAM